MIDASVWRYPGAVSPDECARIIDAARPYAKEHKPRGGGLLVSHPVDDIDERIGRDVFERLATVAAHAAHRSGWEIPFDIVRVGVTQYRAGDWMAEHVDDEERWGEPLMWTLPHRGVSMSVPLSSGHEGGQLRLRYDGDRWLVPQAERGTAICFGSSLPHEVTAVTEGERWVLLLWAYCNHDLRRIP